MTDGRGSARCVTTACATAWNRRVRRRVRRAVAAAVRRRRSRLEDARRGVARQGCGDRRLGRRRASGHDVRRDLYDVVARPRCARAPGGHALGGVAVGAADQHGGAGGEASLWAGRDRDPGGHECECQCGGGEPGSGAKTRSGPFDPTRTNIAHLTPAPARMCASECRWPGWRRRWRSTPCSTGCPTYTSTQQRHTTINGVAFRSPGFAIKLSRGALEPATGLRPTLPPETMGNGRLRERPGVCRAQ